MVTDPHVFALIVIWGGTAVAATLLAVVVLFLKYPE